MEFIKNIYKKIFNGFQNESEYQSTITPPDIIAFGNVLLDMTVQIENTDILHRYNLEVDAQGEISIITLQKIAEELKSRTDIISNPGGSALNTCRILKVLNGKEAIFFGSVGNDDIATSLKQILKENDIRNCLQVIQDYPTGQCFCFVYGDKNSLYANIGASSKLDQEFICSSFEKFQILSNDSNKLQIFYLEGFFVAQGYTLCQYVIENYISEKRILVFNLSAPYIIRENIEKIQYIVEHSSIIFGNTREFLTLAESYNLNSIQRLLEKLLSSKRILVITSGSEKVHLYYNEYSSSQIAHKEFIVKKLKPEEIVDTTGAGDSFVAGFLNCYLENSLNLEDCLEAGCDVASKVITQIGCNLP